MLCRSPIWSVEVLQTSPLDHDTYLYLVTMNNRHEFTRHCTQSSRHQARRKEHAERVFTGLSDNRQQTHTTRRESSKARGVSRVAHASLRLSLHTHTHLHSTQVWRREARRRRQLYRRDARASPAFAWVVLRRAPPGVWTRWVSIARGIIPRGAFVLLW